MLHADKQVPASPEKASDKDKKEHRKRDRQRPGNGLEEEKMVPSSFCFQLRGPARHPIPSHFARVCPNLKDT